MSDGHAPAQPPRSESWLSAAMARIPRPPRGDSRRFLLIAVTTCLCLATAGLSLAVFFTPGSGKKGQLSSAGASTSASAASSAAAPAGTAGRPPASVQGRQVKVKPAKVKPKGAARPATETVLTWPATLSHQMTRWAAGPGGAALGKVAAQLGVAMQAAGVKLYVVMKQACATLSADSGAARTGPPIPDHVMQESYVQALAGLSQAASDCQAAISVRASGDETTQTQVHTALLNRARQELAVMSKRLYRATAAVSALRR